MIDYKTVGLRIRAVRQEKKLTQEKLAEAAGVGVTHISHIETGNSIPSLQVTVDIVNALGCSMDELLCMDVERARSVRDNWLGELVADCSVKEVKLITDMVLALKTSLRRLKLTERYRPDSGRCDPPAWLWRLCINIELFQPYVSVLSKLICSVRGRTSDSIQLSRYIAFAEQSISHYGQESY